MKRPLSGKRYFVAAGQSKASRGCRILCAFPVDNPLPAWAVNAMASGFYNQNSRRKRYSIDPVTVTKKTKPGWPSKN